MIRNRTYKNAVRHIFDFFMRDPPEAKEDEIPHAMVDVEKVQTVRR